MTIEIKQLVIRAVAEALGKEAPSPIHSIAPPGKQAAEEECASAGGFEEHDVLVAACVREVLRELERARER